MLLRTVSFCAPPMRLAIAAVVAKHGSMERAKLGAA